MHETSRDWVFRAEGRRCRLCVADFVAAAAYDLPSSQRIGSYAVEKECRCVVVGEMHHCGISWRFFVRTGAQASES